MTIIYATDENYAPICAVSISSLINNNPMEELIIYIISDNLSIENKRRFKEYESNSNVQILFIDMDKIREYCISECIPQFKGGYTSYARLFFDTFLEDERVLYIDCDTLVVGNLSELWRENLSGCVAGAVSDITHAFANILLGRDDTDLYFNAGVMLIDLKAWKAHGVTKKVMEIISTLNISKTATESDQDIINLALSGMIKKLPLQYNMMSLPRYTTPKKIYYMTGKNANTYYSTQEIQKAKAKPIIIHFAGGCSKRPWFQNSICTNKEKELWDYYKNHSSYSEFEYLTYTLKGIKGFIRKVYVKRYPWIICILQKAKVKRMMIKKVKDK